jgi:2-dehydro-3-deoxygluconokinase
VYYYRQGSAASQMAPGAFPSAYLDGARIFHITGVTPALSASCREFTTWAIAEARRRGVQVSYDVNFRSRLWEPEQAAAFVDAVLPCLDILFLSDDEAGVLWGHPPRDLVRALAARGPRDVLLKRGAQGAVAWLGGQWAEVPAYPVTPVDPVGAGDAFAAGYLAGLLWEVEPTARLRLANAMGAFSVFTRGDYEGLPGRKELMAFIDGRRELGR